MFGFIQVLDSNGTMVVYAPAAIGETIVIPSGVKALGEYLFFFNQKKYLIYYKKKKKMNIQLEII